EPPLRRDGAGEGRQGARPDPEVPGPHGAEPVREHGRLDAARARLGLGDRVGGAEPADDRAAAADRAAGPGHVPGRLVPPDAERSDRGGDLDLGHLAGLARPADSARMSAPAVAIPPDALTDVRDDEIYVASQWQLMWWKFRRHRAALIGAGVVALLYFVAIFC